VTRKTRIVLSPLFFGRLLAERNTKFIAKSSPCRGFHPVPALMVWLLLVPPWVGLGSFDAKAQLDRWYQAAEFRSLAECVQYRNSKIVALRSEAARRNSKASAQAAGTKRLYEQSRCVSENDLRVGEH